MFFNPTTTQTMATNVECTPDIGTPLIAKVPPAAAVDSTRRTTPTNPKVMRVCVEGIPARGKSPKKKLFVRKVRRTRNRDEGLKLNDKWKSTMCLRGSNMLYT